MTHVVVGGGLAGGLVALALAQAGRGRGLTLIEQGQRLGGNHTWSFHQTDLDAEGSALLTPLLCRHWPRQTVRFPGWERTFARGYASVTSDRFADLLAARLEQAGARVLLGRRVVAAESGVVHLEDGTAVSASVVLDARGPDPEPTSAAQRLGFQKFLGLELELGSDGPWTDPVLMDATVPQRDGYRFVYVLPFSPRRVLIEDTIYSGNPRLDAFELERRILAYASEHGAHVARVLRRETGVLPLPLNEPAAKSDQTAPIAIGYRGGFFHPVTGYSLPQAARVAVAVAKAPTAAETRASVGALFRQLGPQRRFGHLLNRLMFEAMPPATRWTALDRFYRLPEPTIERFYASRNTLVDRARILIGRPPAGLSWKHLWRPQAEIA